MEGRKIVLFIQSYFKHVYTLFVELNRANMSKHRCVWALSYTAVERVGIPKERVNY